MKFWLFRATVAAIRSACPIRLTTFCAWYGKDLPPLILVPGATPSQEQECCAEAKAEQPKPIPDAITRAVSGPAIGPTREYDQGRVELPEITRLKTSVRRQSPRA